MKIQQQLMEIMGQQGIAAKESMRYHTSFRIGGPADLFIEPVSIQQLQRVVDCCNQNEFPWMVMGNGSNLLVLDGGIEGAVIALGQSFSDYQVTGDSMEAQAGVLLTALSRYAQQAGLNGLSFAAGIPGSLGGAIAMNAGAYGGCMADVVQEALVMDRRGEISLLSKEELDFGYRSSVILHKQLTVLSARLKLALGDKAEIWAQMEGLLAQRREKQPLQYPSAGSVFKRPPGDFAGRLIEKNGFKGCTIGGAQVSEKHAGFIINIGNATAEDVLQLIKRIQQGVFEKDRVRLETEIRIVGRGKAHA